MTDLERMLLLDVAKALVANGSLPARSRELIAQVESEDLEIRRALIENFGPQDCAEYGPQANAA